MATRDNAHQFAIVVGMRLKQNLVSLVTVSNPEFTSRTFLNESTTIGNEDAKIATTLIALLMSSANFTDKAQYSNCGCSENEPSLLVLTEVFQSLHDVNK